MAETSQEKVMQALLNQPQHAGMKLDKRRNFLLVKM